MRGTNGLSGATLPIPRIILVAGIVVTGLFAAGLPAAGSAAAGRPALSGSAEAGAHVARLWCASCHAIGDDAATATDQAPPFRSIAKRRSPDYLRGFLAHPHAPMPPLELSRDDIESLVAYIKAMTAE